MKNIAIFMVVCAVVSAVFVPSSYAGKDKTWSNVGKGLAIYEGVKVLTGREGNIVQDVTGGTKPAGSSSSQQSSGGDYQSGYDTGYRTGYEAGYNAGFRAGIQHDEGK